MQTWFEKLNNMKINVNHKYVNDGKKIGK